MQHDDSAARAANHLSDQNAILRDALTRIVALAPDGNLIPLDQAFATVRAMKKVAKTALEG